MACKPLPILSNMPWHVQQKITGFTDPYTQMNLQLCSKDLRNAVNKAPSVYESLKISLFLNTIEISMWSSSSSSKHLDVSFEKSDILEEAMKFLEKIFYKTPRSLVTVKELTLELENSILQIENDYEDLKSKFIHKLKSFGYFHANKLNLWITASDEQIASALSMLHPGTLHSISIYCHTSPSGNRDVLFTETAALEQWKKARAFSCVGIRCIDPYDTWKHLEVGTLQVAVLNLETFRDLIERFEKSTTWKIASWIIPDLDPAVLHFINQLEKIDNDGKFRLIRIPNCDTHEIHVIQQLKSVMLYKNPKE